MDIRSLKGLIVALILCASQSTVLAVPAPKISLFSNVATFASAERKTLYKVGAALGGAFVLYNVIDPVFSYFYYINEGNASLLEAPSPEYKKQPQTVAELQEFLQAAASEDYALMASTLENPYITNYLSAMGKTQLRNHSRVGAISLASVEKIKKDGKPTISITWASVPGLSEQQIQQLNQLQYRYVREFSHAINPNKKTYEVTTVKTNILGKKTGFYYHGLTLKQKRKAQEMHMRNALSCAKTMMDMLQPVQAQPQHHHTKPKTK
jgi:hypothetical protein